MIRRKRLSRAEGRNGTTLVEMAVVLPVFFTFVFGIFEFGYAYMVVASLNSAANKAARMGVAEGVTTAQVVDRVNSLLSQSFDTSNATVYVKDGALFDTLTPNAANLDYATLPGIELSAADPQQLFIVRVEIPYEDIAIMPPFWVTGVTLKGQAVMRHE